MSRIFVKFHTEGWATCVLLEAGAIRECEEHGWMKDRADSDGGRARAISCQAKADPALPFQPIGCGRACLLRTQLPRSVPTCWLLRRQGPARCATERYSGRAADQIRPCPQLEDR